MEAPNTRSRIVEILESRGYHSGEALAKSLKISRQALNKQIQSLRQSGYKIEGVPRKGYQLIFKPDRIDVGKIESLLTTDFIGRKIYYFSEIGSTQDKVKELAEKGEQEGALCLAERQTSGRGRLGRSWVSGSGGLWFSVLLRPCLTPNQIPLLSLVSSVAIVKGIERVTSQTFSLKWPNDILFEVDREKYKKVCGILVEMASEADRVNWVVMGCGLNVNNEIPKSLEKTATSLKSICSFAINRVQLLSVILTELENHYERFLREGFTSLRKEYLDRFVFLGKRVMLTDFEGEIEGECVTVDSEGSLILLTRDNKKEKFSFGEVNLR